MPHQKFLIDHAVALALEGNLRTQHVCHHSAAEIDVLPTHAAERRPWVKLPKDAKPDRHYAVCADVIGPAYSPDTEHAKKSVKNTINIKIQRMSGRITAAYAPAMVMPNKIRQKPTLTLWEKNLKLILTFISIAPHRRDHAGRYFPKAFLYHSQKKRSAPAVFSARSHSRRRS